MRMCSSFCLRAEALSPVDVFDKIDKAYNYLMILMLLVQTQMSLLPTRTSKAIS